MSEGTYPDLYKIAKITPLYKAKDKRLFVNYRPVSVLPSVSKVLERLMYNRMYGFFTDCDILVSNQYGFRSGHSTVLVVSELYGNIIKGLDKVNTHWW